MRILLPLGAAWLAVLALGPAAMAEPMDGAEQVDDIARLMAGLSTEDSAWARFEQRRSWVEYGQAIELLEQIGHIVGNSINQSRRQCFLGRNRARIFNHLLS